MTKKPFRVLNGRTAHGEPPQRNLNTGELAAIRNGKPCGDSFIPDDHECRGEGAAAERGTAAPSGRDALGRIIVKPSDLPKEVVSMLRSAGATHVKTTVSKNSNGDDVFEHRIKTGGKPIPKEAVLKKSPQGSEHHQDNTGFRHEVRDGRTIHKLIASTPLAKYSNSLLADEGFAAIVSAESAEPVSNSTQADDEKKEPETIKASCGDELAEKLKKATVSNAGNSEGAVKGWLTRRGGVRADQEYDDENGVKHVKLTIQGREDGQKNVEVNLPKEVHAAIAAGKWTPDADLEKHSKGEDFHTIHGYEPVGALREKYGKGGEVDQINGKIGGQIGRAKAYFSRARDFADGSEAANVLRAKAESVIREIHDKLHPALATAKAKHTSGAVGNRYHALLNSFRQGALLNYGSDVEDMLEEVAEYAERGEALPWDLLAEYEEWLEENE